jgi:pimeloyl-ACP methyl ester carboxylesterase
MPKVQLPTGVDLYYHESGTGPAVVLLQGTGFALDVWEPHPVEELSKSFRVVTLDPRQIGRSVCEDTYFTIEHIAADVAELLAALKIESAHIIGHSIGGRIGLALALNYPKRVRSLVLAASGSGSATRAGEDAVPMPPHRLMKRLIERGLEEHVRYEIMDTIGYFTDKFRAEQPKIVEEFYRTAWKNHADVSTYVRYVLARQAFEISHRLPFLKAPVLILVGAADIGGGEPHLPQAIMLNERIKGSKLRIIDDVTHGFFWQDPVTTEQVLTDWLKAN